MGESEDFIDCGVGVTDRLERLWAPYRMNYIVQKAGAVSTTQNVQTVSDEDARSSAQLQENVPDTRSRLATDSTSTGRSRPNPFIEIPALSDEEGLIIARGELVYCVLNLYPYNSGHMMVVPYREEPNLENLSFAESTELMAFAQAAVRVLKKVSQPDACNVGFNLGRAAGGSVSEHLHLHIVPRWSGDSNFMTVLGGTKVLPQLLRDTRSLLAGAWAHLASIESDFPGVAHA